MSADATLRAPVSVEARTAANLGVQRALVWAGPLMLVLWLASFVILAGFIPTPDPQDSAREVYQRFSANRDSIRIGLVITMAASALLTPFAAVIYSQMKRIEGDRAPLAITQVVSAGVLSLEFIVPCMVWITAAFRIDDESVRIIQMLNDMGWLMFVAVVSTAMIQLLAFGWAILIDQRERPIFPRWAGYFNIWMAFVLTPAVLVCFFKDGAFAWNGLISWYFPLSNYAIWMFLMFYLLRRAIDHEADEAPRIAPSGSRPVA